jgi:hypothetical protein
MLVQMPGIDVSPDQLEGRSELQPGQARSKIFASFH